MISLMTLKSVIHWLLDHDLLLLELLSQLKRQENYVVIHAVEIQYTCILHISIACPADIILPRTCTDSFLMAYYCLPMDVVSPDVPPVQVLQFRATTTRVPQTIPSRFSPLLWGRDRDPCLLSALFWCIPEPPCGSLSPLCCSMRSLAALPHLSLSSSSNYIVKKIMTCFTWKKHL